MQSLVTLCFASTIFILSVPMTPNAGHELLPEAGATQERTL
jgi:hypothetical protein